MAKLILVVGFCLYLMYNYWEQKRERSRGGTDEILEGELSRSPGRILLLFALGLAGVLVSTLVTVAECA